MCYFSFNLLESLLSIRKNDMFSFTKYLSNWQQSVLKKKQKLGKDKQKVYRNDLHMPQTWDIKQNTARGSLCWKDTNFILWNRLFKENYKKKFEKEKGEKKKNCPKKKKKLATTKVSPFFFFFFRFCLMNFDTKKKISKISV
ncbi:hypothetical protein RFI_09953 [Reticulomyxa filosa]|uniref:Uncharacterized protein n=1 Tax=Reticulomyxa filosa TaxID=46433 RepID=X6NP77_RETFI|nr:hypothetical protein RFI_09953 [Reticulomyxa filosa]|eukprot:ETO27177.1 hypothetical protein RFI_09953 [Reticulomyxa filosa]